MVNIRINKPEEYELRVTKELVSNADGTISENINVNIHALKVSTSGDVNNSSRCESSFDDSPVSE